MVQVINVKDEIELGRELLKMDYDVESLLIHDRRERQMDGEVYAITYQIKIFKDAKGNEIDCVYGNVQISFLSMYEKNILTCVLFTELDVEVMGITIKHIKQYEEERSQNVR